MSSCCDCDGIDHHFGPSRAAKELDTYTRRGTPITTRLILRVLQELPLQAESLLDIGAGVGMLHHELLGAGVHTAVHVEAAQMPSAIPAICGMCGPTRCGRTLSGGTAGNPFRTFVHPPDRIHALLNDGGLRLLRRQATLVWEVVLGVWVDAA
jgi:hypothetical protein